MDTNSWMNKPPWWVIAVSNNRGAFGHAGVMVLNDQGEGLELTLQAYGVYPLPEAGSVLLEIPKSEIPPRKLPKVSPGVAAQIIDEAKVHPYD